MLASAAGTKAPVHTGFRRRKLAGMLIAIAVLLPAAPGAVLGQPVQARGAIFYTVDADGSYTATETWDIHAKTASAAWAMAEEPITAVTPLERLDVIEAWTRKSDGRRVPVAADFLRARAASVFLDRQTITLVFPDVAAGDTMHVRFRRTNDSPLHARGFVLAQSFPLRVRALDLHVEISAPHGMTLRHSGAPWSYAVHDNEEQTIHELDISGEKLPPASTRIDLDVSSFPSYEALAEDFAALSPLPARPSDTVTALARRIVGTEQDPMRQARLLYDWVSLHIRPVEIEIGAGALIPHASEAVLAAGYGDCKDHVRLLADLLRVVGIRSIPVLLGQGEDGFVLPDVPTYRVLNHEIIYLPDLDIYADPSIGFASFGTIQPMDYDKPAIQALPQDARVVRLPPLRQDLNWVRITTEAELTATGRLSGTTVTTASGPMTIAMRQIAAQVELRGSGLVAVALSRANGLDGTASYALPPPQDVSDPVYRLSGSFDYHVPFPPPAGFRMPVLSLFGRPGDLLLPAGRPGREPGCFAGTEVEDIRIRLPPGITPSLPPSASVSAGPASYASRYGLDAGALVIRRAFAMKPIQPPCTSGEAEEWGDVVKAAREDRSRVIRFEAARD